MPVLEVANGTSLFEELQQVRRESDRFFSIIKRESLYDRPIDARHRVIFYIGHLDGFDSIITCRETLRLQSADEALDTLFEAGIDPEAGHLPNDQPANWPNIDQVLAYVDRCRRKVDDHLAEVPAEIVEMLLEHRLMHMETLAYMFHNFPFDRKQQQIRQTLVTSGETPDNPWVRIPAGRATLGKARGPAFGWDNEFEELLVDVPGFQIQTHSVTNGDYLCFVENGGSVPNFWSKRDNGYYWRGMFEELPLPLDWPVYVTQTQAKDYADWQGLGVPTEAQFHRAAYGTPSGEERPYPWGSAAPELKFGNFDFSRWDPEPVYVNRGESAFGVHQLVGNGWEWTDTEFAPFPGFAPRAEYPGYSANFFDGEHFVMKGASPLTGARLLRRSFRNWFRRDYPYMYAKFRCVKHEE